MPGATRRLLATPKRNEGVVAPEVLQRRINTQVLRESGFNDE
jgi:hypothetical protein